MECTVINPNLQEGSWPHLAAWPGCRSRCQGVGLMCALPSTLTLQMSSWRTRLRGWAAAAAAREWACCAHCNLP